jgi:hypothetical protein
MGRWLCPDCGRFFGRSNQSHVCERGLSLRDYLAAQPEPQRAIYRAVLAILNKLGDVDIDPVGVGIMVKRMRTFCELHPKRNAVSLSFKLSRAIDHPRIARAVRCSAHRMAYFVDLHIPKDVDGQVRDWIREAYLDSPP